MHSLLKIYFLFQVIVLGESLDKFLQHQSASLIAEASVAVIKKFYLKDTKVICINTPDKGGNTTYNINSDTLNEILLKTNTFDIKFLLNVPKENSPDKRFFNIMLVDSYKDFR